MTYLPGEILLEKYRIETLLGQGAFGDVYRVTNLAVNAPRAVKVLRRDAPGMGSADYKERHRRFQLEAQLGAQLNSSGEHPSPQGDSPFACADMAGNVWEWCSDWYDAKYYRKSPGSNPPGPSAGLYRVMRGGSWMSRNPDLRMTARDGGDPLGRFSITGFRCACDGDTFHALKSTT